MKKKTSIFVDDEILKEFKKTCKAHGRIISHVMAGFMIQYVTQNKLDSRKKSGTKKTS